MGKLSFKALAEHGFGMHFKTEWVGEVGKDRREIPTKNVYNVFIKLSPAEWCAMCQHEGRHYIGPCCGNTGAMQDIINGVFREGGWIEAGELYELGYLGAKHEQWEDHLFGAKHIGGTFSITKRKDFNLALSKWRRLSPWGKIGLAYAALKERLEIGRDLKPQVKRTSAPLSDEEAFHTMANTCRLLSWERFWNKNPEGTQHVADRGARLARLLMAMTAVRRVAEAQFKPYEGFAIVRDADNEVISDGYGLCLYLTKDEPEKLVADMVKKDATTAGLTTIRPARVTLEEGLVLI